MVCLAAVHQEGLAIYALIPQKVEKHIFVIAFEKRAATHLSRLHPYKQINNGPGIGTTVNIVAQAHQVILRL